VKLIVDISDETYKEAMDRTEFDTLTLGIKLIEVVQNSTPIKDWLSTFNTYSATECFTAVQQLKETINDRGDTYV
jgi:hypothetical protein